jgi:hypothetical protein
MASYSEDLKCSWWKSQSPRLQTSFHAALMVEHRQQHRKGEV